MDQRTVTANGIEFSYLSDGPPDGPLALCLHGFPDTAHTWRHLLPRLAGAGYHAVAPFMRGYAPTPVAPDGRYDTGTLALDACALHARWVDVFCEVGAFDLDQSRAILEAGRAAGLGLRVHGNQLGFGPGVQLACALGAASVDHCTFMDDGDLGALAASETVATFLPATDFATRQPYPDARRAITVAFRS